jgi:hypothetical protein
VQPPAPIVSHSSVPVRDARGRVVGTVRTFAGQRVLFRRVLEQRHRLRHPAAWAQDAVVLDQARRAGAKDVVLEDRHAGRRWTAPLDAFEKHGFCFDRGHGPQVALPLDQWRVEDLRDPAQVDLFSAAGVPA